MTTIAYSLIALGAIALIAWVIHLERKRWRG